jgi:hypothetical protein
MSELAAESDFAVEEDDDDDEDESEEADRFRTVLVELLGTAAAASPDEMLVCFSRSFFTLLSSSDSSIADM